MKVAVLGLGQMGAPIAANILRAGHDLTVWNRSPGKARALVEAGATLAPTPRAAARGRDVVLTMLADDAALEAVLAGDEGLLAGLEGGGLHVSLSTITVAAADAAAARHASHGQGFVSAPVFGRPDAAAAAQLFVIAAGAGADIARARPVLEAIGQRLFIVGERPSAANLIKLCGNFAILAAIGAMGEAMALVEKGGGSKAQLLEVLTNTMFDARVYRNYGAILVDERYRPAGCPASLGLEIVDMIGQAAERSDAPMPTLALLRDRLAETIEREGADIDWSAIARTSARNAGL
jgi:3-hydroxyisobutyrate dehydrogenase-like beta-hydroxyacid dehydrogenase